MRRLRTAAAAASIALVGAAATLGPASATAHGVGTGFTTTRMLSAQLGTNGALLNLTLIGDEARSTIDPAVAQPEAYTRLTAATVSSKVAALNVSVPPQPLESRSPGGQPEVAYGGATLPTPAVVASGSVRPARLFSSVDGGTATSGLASEVSDISLLAGLVQAKSLKSVLSTTGAPALAEATRSASAGDITVLDLSALLRGLGISLGDLPVSTVIALVDQLKAPVSDVPTGTTMSQYVKDINAAIDDLQSAVDPVTDEVSRTVDSTTSTLLGSVALDAPSIGEPVSVVNATVDQLQGLLDTIVANGVRALDSLALLRLEGLEVGIGTKAVDSVDDSTATIIARIGKVFVGGIEIPGLDLTRATSQVPALAGTINTEIENVLKLVDVALKDVVSVSVLDQDKSVSSSGGYTRSRASVTALSVAITPPAALSSIVSGITADNADVTAALGSAMPALSTAMSTLQSTLAMGASVLSQPATLKIGEVVGSADFIPASGPVPAPGGRLPTTGGPGGLAVLACVLLGGVAIGIFRWVNSPEVRGTR